MPRFSTPALAAIIAAALFLPLLGSVGLWDPWETNYAEAAREMLERGDLIHPHWEQAWFFSKPVLALWLMLPGLWLTGAAQGDGPLSGMLEWLVRLPFALFAIAAVAMLADVVARSTSRRRGLLAGTALATMPRFFFVARQAITDMAYVAPMTVATLCGARALLLEKDAAQRRWWRWCFALCGVATLGKGMLGFGLPAVTLMGFALLTSRRYFIDAVRGVPWLSGVSLWAVIALPWYLAMFAFDAHDAEGLTFYQRFIVHDHFERLGAGVHTTTPGGSFTYFIEQLGFGVFPWVALVPAALASALQLKRDGKPSLQLLFTVWVVLSFGLFSASATRFHHYILPLLPALAGLIALARVRLPALLCGGVLLGLVTKDLCARPRDLVDLFTYNHERAYPDFLWTPGTSHALMAAVAACIVLPLAARVKVPLLALALAAWMSWVHWPALSQHWTQRELFSRYYALRRDGEPIAAFWMDWKGETFYSRNAVLQVKPGHEALAAQLAQRPGRAWFLVEHFRLNALQQVLGPTQRIETVEPQLNNKFVLVVASDVPSS
jgi:4-amino-4-deoxy-L-arabinose transferase-like glycosyltransferase